MVNILVQQVEALLMAAEAYLAEQFLNFPEVLTQLCKKYLKITGDFDAAGFSKALSKQGIYPINSNRLASVISQTWEDVCRRPLGLPSTETATIGQMFQQSGPHAMASLLAEIKVAVTQRPDTAMLPAFRESFREGFTMSEREYLETYSEEIFGQWRQMWAGLGVILPDTFASQQ